MVDIFKAENLDPNTGLPLAEITPSRPIQPTARPLSPALGIPEAVGAGGLQGILNMLVGAQNIYRRLPPTLQHAIIGAATPELPGAQMALRPITTRKPVQPFTFAQQAPYPGVAGISAMVSPFLIPFLPEVRGISAAARALPAAVRLGARGLETGLTGAGYGALFGAEAPGAKLTAPMGIGAALGATMAPISPLLRTILPLEKAAQPFIKEKINAIINTLKGPESKENINRAVFDQIGRYYDELMGHSEDLEGNPITAETYQYVHPENSVSGDYSQLHNVWNQLGLTNYNRSAYDKAIDKEINNLNTEKAQFENAPLFKEDKDKAINLLNNYKNSYLDTFAHADTLKKLLNTNIRELKSPRATEQEKAIKSSLSKIKSALRQTAQDTVNDYGSAMPLQEAWQNADTRFKNQIVPFRETAPNKISPFYKRYDEGGHNVDNFLKSYIKPEQEDLLTNFMKMVPDENTRKLASYDYFKDTEENPESFIKKYNKLTSNQQQMLLPEHKSTLDDLSNLYKTHKALFKQPSIGLFAKPGIRGGLIGAAALAGYTHHPLLAALALEPTVAEAGAEAYMGIPALRERYLASMLRPERAFTTPLQMPALRGGLATLLQPPSPQIQIGGQ